MALRMLRYQGRVWDRYVRQHPRATALPAILPAVVYQGGGLGLRRRSYVIFST